MATIYVRFTRQLGPPPHDPRDDWDPDTAIYHHAKGGRTLCGVRVSLETRYDWMKLERDRPNQWVNCQRCISIAERRAMRI